MTQSYLWLLGILYLGFVTPLWLVVAFRVVDCDIRKPGLMVQCIGMMLAFGLIAQKFLF